MQDSQNSNKELKKITTLKQLLSSYYVSKALTDLRKDRAKELSHLAKESLPKIMSDNKEIIDLYERFSEVVDYKPVLLKIAKKGLEDVEKYNFEEDSSINKAATVDTEHLRNSLGTHFALLENINLRDHTLRVFKNAIEIGENKGRAIQVAIPILSCLFHDFGKSKIIREKFLGVESGQSYKKHASVSKTYVDEELRSFFSDSQDTIDTIALLVENHHPNNNKMKRDQNIAFIIDADHKARKEEVELIKKLKKGG